MLDDLPSSVTPSPATPTEASAGPDAAAPDVGAERVFSWGTGPVFSADGRWLAWTADVSSEEKVEVGDRMKVLEVGTGSGYQSAVLARLARRVYTIERLPDLMAEAQQRFDELRLHNITTKLADGTLGWP